MFSLELAGAIEDFAAVMLPLSTKDLERQWVWKDHAEEGVRFAFFVTIQELRALAVTLASLRTPLTPAHRILGQYHAQYRDLQAAIFGLAEADSERAPAENEWSIRKIYGHILGAEIGFSAVVRNALEQHRSGTWTPQPMSDEDEMRITGMSEQGYRRLVQGPLRGMLVFHREFHPKVIEEFSTITAAELDLPSTFWEETRFPIRHRLHRFEAHIVQHTVQIDKALAAIDLAPSETKRLIRYLFAALAEVESSLIGENAATTGYTELCRTTRARTDEIREILG